MTSHDLAKRMLALPDREVCLVEPGEPIMTVQDVDVHRTMYDGDVIRLYMTKLD